MAINFFATGASNNGATFSTYEFVQTNVATNDYFEIPFGFSTTDFKDVNIPKVLYFTPGANNEINVINQYNNGEAINFLANPFVQFDGTLRLKTDYSITPTVSTLGTGKMFTAEINRDSYKSIESVVLV